VHGGSCLNEVVRSFPEPDGPGYVWMAGETRTVRYLRQEAIMDEYEAALERVGL
jgi:NADPH-dependent ferric siderophore reductase